MLITYRGWVVKRRQSCTEFAEVCPSEMAGTTTVFTIVLLTETGCCQYWPLCYQSHVSINFSILLSRTRV